MSGPPADGRRRTRVLARALARPARALAIPSRALVGALAAISYIPLLLTHPGMVGADTKTYLYLDPARLLARASSMWDPNTGMGTVTHENIGYLWPMGPWYRVFAAAGIPMWVAQRLWTGTLLFAAALGVRWLARTLGWSGPGLAVASLAYMLSPYVLQYEARISAILLAWSALPWMIGLTIRAARTGSWRHPALFALVAATAGAVNATCMVFAGLAAVLWLPFGVWGLGEIGVRRALATFAKLLVLSLAVAAWWLAGLVTQSGYGLDILRYTETVDVVSRTGLAFEAVRGLGNWFFYGRDAVGPWVQAAVDYTQRGWLLAASFAVPTVAALGAIAVRWRYKLYFSALILIGVALAVGVHPYQHPSPLGALFKAFATGSSIGLALRSTGRAVPLVALGTAMLLGATVDGLWRRRDLVEEEEDRSRRRRTRLALCVTGGVSVLVLVNMAPLWLGQFVDDNLQAPDKVPSYWTQAARYVGAQGTLPAPAGSGSATGPGYATRVLELPGADFAHYRWGATLDPILPGLTDRPAVSRQLQPAGSAASADLLRALDRRMQEGVLETPALAPLARKMSVGDILLDSDLQYERFRTPQPTASWQQFDPTPAGLQAPATFGPTRGETPVIPYTNEITLGTPTGAPDPPAVAVFGVDQPASIIRTEPAARPLILAGDGEGMVDAAAAGLLQTAQPVFYAADVGTHPGMLAGLLTSGADLVVSDTNKRQAQRWGTIRDNTGYTEEAGEKPLVADPTDARLPLFPGAGDSASTVSEQRGGLDVRASGYGNSVSYSPAARPDQAVDGDLGTAWTVGALGDPIGQYLRIDLAAATTTGRINVVQPFSPPKPAPPERTVPQTPTIPPGTRFITRVTLTFDGNHPVSRDLGLASLTATGQDLTFPTTTFHRVEIRIDATNLHLTDEQNGNGVGFAEVRIGTSPHPPTVDELLRLPTDLLDSTGAASLQHRLTLMMTRDRANPAEPFSSDPEQSMARTFDLPTARRFSIGGAARVSALAPDQEVDRWLGRPDPPLTNSSGRLPGDLAARSSSALDGDPATAWSPAIGPQVGEWLSVNIAQPLTLQHWTMQVVADGRHSVPTSLQVLVDDRPAVVVALPAVRDRTGVDNATVAVPVSLPAAVTVRSRITFVIGSVRAVTSKDALSGEDKVLPVGIAELGLPGLRVPPAGSAVPAGCRTDLLTVDGKPVGLRILGSTATAARRDALAIQACGPGVDATGALALGAGSHVVRTTPGHRTGIDLDRLILSSEAGGQALGAAPGGGAPPSAGTAAGGGPAAATGAPPAVVVAQGRTSARVDIAAEPVATPFWLVLGQSVNRGWTARVTGRGGKDLGPPHLIDGYANGWLVDPRPDQPMTIALRWTPQRTVDLSLWISLVAALSCLAVAVLAPRSTSRALAAPAAGRLPELPIVTRPGRSVDPALGWRAAAVTTVACGIAATLLIGWAAGLLVAAVMALGMLRGRWQALPGALGVTALGASGLFVTQQQLAHHYSLILEWPQHFSAVADLAWVGVVLLSADAAVRHLRGRRSRRP